MVSGAPVDCRMVKQAKIIQIVYCFCASNDLFLILHKNPPNLLWWIFYDFFEKAIYKLKKQWYYRVIKTRTIIIINISEMTKWRNDKISAGKG